MTIRGTETFCVIAWLASPVVLLMTGWLVGLRLNLTGSLPLGVYLTSKPVVARGTLVLAESLAKLSA